MPSTSPLRATLILPTYNERENLPLLVAAIQALPIPIRIIVVDDNSPDGTGALADELARRSLSVEVIHRSDKQGLGTAYAAGFRQAMATGTDLVMTMDADFSHDPQYLPALLEASQYYDLVIGSRYVPGGGVRNWPRHRQMLSWSANTLARLMLGLHARDCTAGFRCYRRQVLETVDPGSIRANGYSYLIEMLDCCQRAGFKIGEVPIVFTDRQLGQSKISRGEIFKAGRTVLRLALRRLSKRGRHAKARCASEQAAR